MNEEKVRQNIKQREGLIVQKILLNEQEMTKWQNELQKEHQKVLFWEAQTKGEERKKFAGLRQEIEKQQQQIAQPEQLDYQSTAMKLVPPQTVVKNLIMAFLVGGSICLIGQIFYNLFTQGGLGIKDASAAASSMLVFLGALFTGLGYYDELGKVAGAGSIVPITGFANSIVSSALEFKREGYLYGVGARLFTVAGPILVYGTMVSILVGLVYYFAW